jgi:hypothetical protein
MEEKPQEERQLTLAVPHDVAVAIAAASIHYRVLLAGLTEMTPIVRQLDDVYRLILQNPQLPLTAKAFLRDMRLVVAGLKDEEEGS